MARYGPCLYRCQAPDSLMTVPLIRHRKIKAQIPNPGLSVVVRSTGKMATGSPLSYALKAWASLFPLQDLLRPE